MNPSEEIHAIISSIDAYKIIECSPDGILLTDLHGIILFANAAAMTLFGQCREELMGQPFGCPVGKEQTQEITLVQADGVLASAELRVVDIEWDGQSAFLIALRDITRRKALETELKELNASLEQRVVERTAELMRAKEREIELMRRERVFLEGVATSVPAILLVTRNDQVEVTNEGFKKLFGFKPEPGTLIQDVLYRIGVSGQTIAHILESKKESRKQEVELLNAQGGAMILEFHSSGVILDDELFLLGIADVTNQRRSEERERFAAFQSGLAEMSATLLHNIGNAVAAILPRIQRLSRDQQELLQVSELVARIRHAGVEKLQRGDAAGDILAGLLKVMDEVGGRLRKFSNEKLGPTAQVICDGVEHIAEIIRIQQSAVSISQTSTSFKLKRMLEDVLIMDNDALEKLGIGVELVVEKELDEVMLPHSQMIQTVLNLLKNSRDAIEERAKTELIVGQITITARVVGSGIFELRFADNGCGVAQEKLGEIFRFGYTTKNRGGGFGLHFIANFIQSLGGSIEAKSAGQNQGMVIEILMPVRYPKNGQ